MTIASEMHCPVTQFLMQYLGLPLSIHMPSTTSLLLIIHKLERKLSMWRVSLLFKGDPMTLVRYVL